MIATEEDLLRARDLVRGMGTNSRRTLGRFRDGVHVDARELNSLERIGFLAALDDGSWVALPGVLEAFAEAWGPALRVEHHVRFPEGNARVEKAAVMASIPGALGFKAAGKEARKAKAPASVVAVPAARVESVHPGDGGGVGRGPAQGWAWFKTKATVKEGVVELSLKSTDKVVTLVIGGGEVPARIWEGCTASGIKVHAYITRVAVKSTEDQAEFVEELKAHDPPSEEVRSIPLRLIL